MPIQPGSIEHLTQIISQVVGPSFLLGAVASFIGMLFGRMGSVVDRIRAINAMAETDPLHERLRADIPRLKGRVSLLVLAIRLSIVAGVATTLLIITAFAAAFLHRDHTYGAALLFTIALAFFLASLAVLAREVKLSVHENDYF